MFLKQSFCVALKPSGVFKLFGFAPNRMHSATLIEGEPRPMGIRVDCVLGVGREDSQEWKLTDMLVQLVNSRSIRRENCGSLFGNKK